MLRAEARMAGAELKVKLRKGAKAGILLAIAGLFGFFAMACFTTALIVALFIVLPLWLSALVSGILFAGIAGAAFVMGRMALEDVDLVPQRSIETLRDTIDRIKTEWHHMHPTDVSAGD